MKFVSLLLFTFFLSSLAQAASPAITLRYSSVFDSWCSQNNDTTITTIETERLLKILPELQAAWDKLGPQLLKKTEEIIAKPFVQNELIATIFLCKKTPSMSMPLLINGNWFATETPMTADIVVDIIFHELLHTYLVDNFTAASSSALLTKYKNEDTGVLSHLHLMALQKKVYLELGLTERATKVIQFDSLYYRGAYKRSWEIVNQEHEDRFIYELNPDHNKSMKCDNNPENRPKN